MEESAAIAGVRVIATLSTYSDLEDEGSSDDLESEVERADLTSRRQRHQQPIRFSTRGRAANSPRGRVLPNTKRSKSVCCETSRAWPKREPEISSRAI